MFLLSAVSPELVKQQTSDVKWPLSCLKLSFNSSVALMSCSNLSGRIGFSMEIQAGQIAFLTSHSVVDEHFSLSFKVYYIILWMNVGEGCC